MNVEHQRTVNEALAGQRQTALFAVGLSWVLAGLIPLCRLGFDPLLQEVFTASGVLTFVLLLPFILLERLPRIASLPQRDFLVGPLVVASLLLALSVSYLGALGVMLITLGAVITLGDAAQRGIRVNGLRGLWRWLVVGFFVFVPLLAALQGSKYANFIADQLALYGRADGDTLFHAAIINGLRFFGTASTGIDGVQPLTYHIGAHFIAARLAAMSHSEAIPALIALRAPFLTPLLLFAVAQSSLVWSRLRGAKGNALAACGLSLLAILGLPAIGLGVGSLNSESFMLAPTLLLFAFTPIYALFTDKSLILPFRPSVIWCFGIFMIIMLAISKISVGYVFAGVLGYTAFRTYGIRSWQPWLLIVTIGSAFLVSFWAFGVSKGQSGVTLFGVPYYIEYGFHGGHPLLPLTANIEGLAFCTILAARLRHGGLSIWQGFQQRKTVGLEMFAVIFILANLPGLVLEIPGGDATYFIQVFDWAAKPLLVGEVLAFCGRLRRNRADVVGWWRWLVAAVVTGAILSSLIGLVVSMVNQTFLAASMNALVRTGDLTYFQSNRRKQLRADAGRAIDAPGWAGLLNATPPRPPAEELAQALLDARASGGNLAGLYVPPNIDSFWSLTKDCDGKSLFSMAVGGIPMLNGYYPRPRECVQEFSLSGYTAPAGDLPTLADPAICAIAKARSMSTVLIANGLGATSVHILLCTP